MDGNNPSSVHTQLSVEKFFQLTCEYHSAPMFILDHSNGEILRFNHAAEKLYGYCPADAATRGISDVIPSLTAEAAPLSGLEGCRTDLHRLADGSLHTIEMHAARLSLVDASILFCILRDMTEHVRIERTNEHLDRAREQLEIIVNERTRQLNETMEHLRLETLERRLIESDVTTIQERLESQERARVARDIHDGIGQSLQAVKLQLKMRQARCKEGEACGGYALSEVIREITSVSTELREIILALRPQFLEETDLDVAVRALCERTAKRTNLNVRAECHGTYRGINAPLKLSVFRICQEALANIGKHARSANATVATATP